MTTPNLLVNLTVGHTPPIVSNWPIRLAVENKHLSMVCQTKHTYLLLLAKSGQKFFKFYAVVSCDFSLSLSLSLSHTHTHTHTYTHTHIHTHTVAPTISSLTYQEASRTLTCVSTGSPPTVVEWMKNGQPLTIDGSLYSLSQTVTDRAASTYDNTLTVSERAPGGVAGNYTCTVSNSLGFPPAIMTVVAVGELEYTLSSSVRCLLLVYYRYCHLWSGESPDCGSVCHYQLYY